MVSKTMYWGVRTTSKNADGDGKHPSQTLEDWGSNFTRELKQSWGGKSKKTTLNRNLTLKSVLYREFCNKGPKSGKKGQAGCLREGWDQRGGNGRRTYKRHLGPTRNVSASLEIKDG